MCATEWNVQIILIFNGLMLWISGFQWRLSWLQSSRLRHVALADYFQSFIRYIFEELMVTIYLSLHLNPSNFQIIARFVVARSPASHLVEVGLWFNTICVAPFYIELAISVMRQETLDFTISTTDSPLLTSVKLMKVTSTTTPLLFYRYI